MQKHTLHTADIVKIYMYVYFNCYCDLNVRKCKGENYRRRTPPLNSPLLSCKGMNTYKCYIPFHLCLSTLLQNVCNVRTYYIEEVSKVSSVV